MFNIDGTFTEYQDGGTISNLLSFILLTGTEHIFLFSFNMVQDQSGNLPVFG
jgi:hypothetical protein